jgi:DNA-binding transcriptional regulator YdaS (Cro superfamily)
MEGDPAPIPRIEDSTSVTLRGRDYQSPVSVVRVQALIPELPGYPPVVPASQDQDGVSGRGLRGSWLAPGRMLTRWMASVGLTQSDLAYILDVTQAAVSQWCHGVARPNAIRAYAIQEAGGPHADLWATIAEDFAAKRMRARITQVLPQGGKKKDT